MLVGTPRGRVAGRRRSHVRMAESATIWILRWRDAKCRLLLADEHGTSPRLLHQDTHVVHVLAANCEDSGATVAVAKPSAEQPRRDRQVNLVGDHRRRCGDPHRAWTAFGSQS